MYLEHFGLTELPFSLTPNTQFFCDLPTHKEALNVLITSLHNGDGFLKITGEVGAGKTLLCRMLLDALDEKFKSAYIPNPDLDPSGIRKALAQELGIEVSGDTNDHDLLNQLTEKLMAFHAEGQQVVLIIDEAQTLSEESLETIRLLTNLQTEKANLMQVVLFGQPELNDRINEPGLWQLKQRIMFSYFIKPLTRDQADAYLCHRLSMAGFTKGSLMTRQSIDLLHKASRGIPRLINILSHKALMAAFGRDERIVTPRTMRAAIVDTESIGNYSTAWALPGGNSSWRRFIPYVGVMAATAALVLLFVYHAQLGLLS